MSKQTIMLQEILSQPRVLAGLEAANKEVLTALAQQLRSRGIHHVLFAGRGTSDHASIYGQYLLTVTCGAVCALAQPSAQTLYGAKPDMRDTLVVGVSQSGAAADALAVMQRAKECGALVVAVTNHADSPMALCADYPLTLAAGPEVSVAATKTFTAQLGVMYLLAAYWSENEAMLADFAKLPDAVQRLNEYLDGCIGDVSAPFRYAQECFVLARGMAYPIALETTLKIQETCYVRGKGYAISDFYHGPLAQVDGNTPVLMYLAKGCAYEDSLAMYRKLVEIGAQPLVVTNCPGEAKNCLQLEDTGSEFTQVFLYAVFAQRFAESLCARKGLNPDAPRNLKKVTVTR